MVKSLNKWNLVAVCCGLGLASIVVAGVRRGPEPKALPPIGQRLYNIGTQASPTPVQIEPVRQVVHERFMRDPDQPGQLHVAAPKPVVHKKPQVVQERPGAMRFKRMQVPGHLQQPRLAFRLETLPLERADEPVQNDFYPKVFEPAQDNDF